MTTERAEQERRAQAEREKTEAERTDDQRLGVWISESARPGATQARNVEFLRSLGMLGDDEGER